MFRRTLFATTALVLAATAAMAANFKAPSRPVLQPQRKGISPTVKHNGIATQGVLTGNIRKGVHIYNEPQIDSGVTYSNLGSDANARFISWYGFYTESSCYSYSYSANYHYSQCFNQNVAAPFLGAGKTVTKIKVPVAGPGKYFVGLYNDSSGVPGDLIAGASVSGSSVTYCCHLETAKIGRHYLNAGQQYWVEVTKPSTSPGNGLWLTEDTDFSEPQPYDWQYGYSTVGNFGSGTHTYTSNSGWIASTASPYRPAFLVK